MAHNHATKLPMPHCHGAGHLLKLELLHRSPRGEAQPGVAFALATLSSLSTVPQFHKLGMVQWPYRQRITFRAMLENAEVRCAACASCVPSPASLCMRQLLLQPAPLSRTQRRLQ